MNLKKIVEEPIEVRVHMDMMIEVEGLAMRFGHLTAVDDISFQVARGEVLGFLGPNGAGKSTTMKMITGFLTPSAGRVAVCGHDVVDEAIKAKRMIGYLPEGAPAYGDMTPRRFLRFAAASRGFSGAARRDAVARVVAAVHLEEVLEQPIDTLSKGFKRRVGLAQAILHDPPVLILDEPTDGLDPNQKQEVRDLICAMAAEKATIISTHILEEVDAVCTRAIIIADGHIVADGTPQELRGRSETYNAVVVATRKDGAEEKLRSLVGARKVEALGDGRYRVYPTGGQPILPAVTDLARRDKWPVEELSVESGRLDEVFRRITTQREIVGSV